MKFIDVKSAIIGVLITLLFLSVHDYDMLKPSEAGKPILINIITYEYD